MHNQSAKPAGSGLRPQISYSVPFNEANAALREYFFAVQLGGSTLRLVFLYLLIVGFWFFLYFMLPDDIRGFLILYSFLAAMLPVSQIRGYRQMQRLFRRNWDESKVSEVEIQFGVASLRRKTEKADYTFTPDEVTHILETTQFVWLMQGSTPLAFFPKRVLNPNELLWVHSFFKECPLACRSTFLKRQNALQARFGTTSISQ
jgi:hypothetical protein